MALGDEAAPGEGGDGQRVLAGGQGGEHLARGADFHDGHRRAPLRASERASGLAAGATSRTLTQALSLTRDRQILAGSDVCATTARGRD